MKELPQIFAFYSFKGGVGRSMAVLNLAYALAAKGRHVLVLDMDLEAPGLSGFLHREKEITGFARFDMVDLVSWASSASLPIEPLSFPSRSDYVVSIPREKLESIPRIYTDLGRLDIIPVEDREYYNRLASLSMGSRDQDDLVQIGSILRVWLKGLRFPIEVPDYYGAGQDRSASYDYVLVDSRTGITETGGLCIGPLSDQLVVLTALNDQNIEGTRTFLREVGVLKNGDDIKTDAEPKPYLIVASLVPPGEIRTKSERLKRLGEVFGDVRVKLSYHPQLSLKESIFTRDYRDEYLAREYEDLLRQILLMAGDGDDPVIAETVSKLPLSSPEFRQALRHLLRLAPTESATLLLRHFISTVDFAQISEDVDFILWDRVCHVLSDKRTPSRFDVIVKWAILLSEWGRRSKDPELAALRLQAGKNCCEQILSSNEASSAQQAQALLIRGVTYSHAREPENAIADYTAAINIPDISVDQKVMAQHNRALSHRQRAELDEAIADYTVAIQTADTVIKQRFIDSVYHTVTHSPTFDLAKIFSDFTSPFQSPSHMANVKSRSLVNRGETYREKGELEKAIADYNAVIHMHGTPAEERAQALVNRGALYSQGGEPEKAIEDCSVVIEMSDASVEKRTKALVNRGIIYRQRGDLENAIVDYTAVIQMTDAPFGEKAKALVDRGAVYDVEGEHEKALNDFNAVIRMPEAPTEQKFLALLNRGVAYFKRHELEKAIADYSSIVQMPGSLAEQKAGALIARGATYSKQHDEERAIADFTAVIQMDGAPVDHKAQALFSRGWSQFLQGRYEKAIDDERQSISLSPKNSLAHANLAVALLVQGSISEALAAYNTAFALANSIELDEMSSDLREAIETRGQVPGAEEILARLEVRRQELSQSPSDNGSGSIPHEPDDRT